MEAHEDGPAFESLLVFLREHRGFDFTGYKRPTLVRRVNRRMSDLSLSSYESYLDYLQVHPDEFVRLFNTILINVTGFFRDPDAWKAVAQEAVPQIIERRGNSTQPIRMWSAACSSGQEAYTLAMLLCEALGVDQFRERVKIYGTDVDEEDLEVARQGEFSKRDVRARPLAPARTVLRAARGGPVPLPSRPAPVDHLRASRSDQRRPDRPSRPAGLPQHPHVLQFGGAARHPPALPLRPA